MAAPVRERGVEGRPATAKPIVRVRDHGRRGVRVWAMGELVEEMLRDLETALGKEATRTIKCHMPTWENV